MTTSHAPLTVERPGPTATPPVAVCIPLYNKERFIGATIASILAQTYTDFELVVVDNASADRSVEVVQSFDDPRIVLLRSAATIPMTDNYNRAVAASRAPIVKLVNADDQLEPEALARQVAELDRDPDVVLVSCRQSIIDEHGTVFAREHCLRTPDLIGRQERAAVVRRVVRHGFNPIGNPGNLLFRRSAFDACGGWRGAGIVLDIQLCTDLLRHGAFVGIPADLAIFRLAPASHSTSARYENLRAIRRYVRQLAREQRDVVRLSDRVASALRAPVTVIGTSFFYAASAESDSLLHRLAARGLALRNRSARETPEGHQEPAFT